MRMEKRTKDFASSIIELSSSIPNSIETRVVKNQLIKAGTSIGANYREANRARSKPDFVSKIRICESEASETVYWLEILSGINSIVQVSLIAITDEAKELLAIFSSISKTLKL